MDQRVTINSRKYDGSVRRNWHCRLLETNGTQLVFLGIFEAEVSHPDLGLIRRGTLSYEYYWTDRWYNIFRFHEPNGSLRNYYCNINMPPKFSGDVLDYVDLDIDVLVWPDLSYAVLDEDEFEENAKFFNYPQTVIDQAHRALAEVVDLITSGKLPTV